MSSEANPSTESSIDSTFENLMGTCSQVVTTGRSAIESMRRWLPVEGEPWLLNGVEGSYSIVSDVGDEMCLFEIILAMCNLLVESGSKAMEIFAKDESGADLLLRMARQLHADDRGKENLEAVRNRWPALAPAVRCVCRAYCPIMEHYERHKDRGDAWDRREFTPIGKNLLTTFERAIDALATVHDEIMRRSEHSFPPEVLQTSRALSAEVSEASPEATKPDDSLSEPRVGRLQTPTSPQPSSSLAVEDLDVKHQFDRITKSTPPGLPEVLPAVYGSACLCAALAGAIEYFLKLSPSIADPNAIFNALRWLRKYAKLLSPLIKAAAAQLTATRGSPLWFNKFPAENAHQAALGLTALLLREVDYRFEQLGARRGRNGDVIWNRRQFRDNFAAICQSFQDVYLPDWSVITAEARFEAIKAAPTWKPISAGGQEDEASLTTAPSAKADGCTIPVQMQSPAPKAPAPTEPPGGEGQATELVQPKPNVLSASVPAAPLELIAGGFALHGKPHDLTGKPLAMLGALLKSQYHRCTVSKLREAIGVDDEVVSYPEQVVRDTATTLRSALKEGMKASGLPDKDPLRSAGRGKDLTYILEIP